MSAATDIDGHEYALQHSTAYRLQHAGLEVDGEPFDLTDYPYAIEMLDETAPRTSVIKGAQMGITVTYIAKCVEKARTAKRLGERLRSIIYVFPSDRQVIEFSQARMGPFLDNPLYTQHKSKVDSSGLRVINGVSIYFRAGGVRGVAGKQSLANVKSIPGDGLVEDECDEIEQSRRAALAHRLDSSLNPWHISLSTPTFPGYGISLEIEQSDGRAWHLKCGKCGGWTNLESHFPECIAEPVNGDPYYLCMKCRERLVRRESKGEWVAARPSVKDWRGYILSQMSSLRRSAGDVLKAWDEAEESVRPGAKREFYNQVLGRPYAELDDQLTDELINDRIDSSRPRARQSRGPCAMGVDPGARDLHYVVGDRITDTDSRVLDWGAVSSFDDIAQIAKRFNVQCGVMDQGAEARKVREFVEGTSGWWGCHYRSEMPEVAKWDAKKRHVSADRTQVLDAAHQAVVQRRVSFPANDETLEKIVRPQLKNLARITHTHQETGAVRHYWGVVGGTKNDHMAHAHGYFHLACERVGLSSASPYERAPTRRANRPRSFMAS